MDTVIKIKREKGDEINTLKHAKFGQWFLCDNEICILIDNWDGLAENYFKCLSVEKKQLYLLSGNKQIKLIKNVNIEVK